MEKPKKERKFLKAIGKIGKALAEELVMGIGRKFIGKVVDKVKLGKRERLSLLFLLSLSISFASIDSIPYPITGNKQRLGFNTTGNGLVWRGLASDTVTKPTSYADKNVKAYLVLDSVTGSIYVWKQGAWASLVGGGSFTQPVDSLFFDTSVPTNNVDTAKMRWDYDLGTVVLGMYDKVPNELGFKNFWLVKNQTGSTITKGSIVYANGTVGASGRLTIAKFIANGTIEAKYLLGIAAHDLSNGEDGYVISYGKIRQVNTDTFAAGALLYPSPTVAGAWTDVEPKAPNINMPIGFCINSSSNNGTIAIRVASGYKMHELHDVDTTGLSTGEGLIYNGTYFVASNGAIALQSYVDSIAQNFQDSIDEITNGYFKQEFLSVIKDTLNWTKSVQLPISGSNLLLVYRNGQMLNDAQYSVIDTNKVKINTGSYKIGENYTVVYVKGGGGSGSGGVPFDTSVLNLQARLDLKLNISDTASMLANYATKAYADTTGRFYARQDFSNVSSATLTWTQSDTLITGNSTVLQVYRNGQILLPSQYTVTNSTTITIASTSYKAGENYTVIFPRGGGAGSGGGGSGSLTSISGGTGITVSPNPITTTGTVSADLSVLMELSDTVSLSNRINLKLNTADTASLSNRINTKLNTTDTVNLSNRINLKLNAADTASLSNRINAKGTVSSVATGYGISGGTITTTGTLVLDSATVFTRIRDSIVDVAIGNDTIKILKQEYPAQSSAILNWTVTSKFPIQLKAYILVFRNGQLLNNNQYNITDTAQITLVSTSFKSGANYTIATVSGIGSVGTGIYPNPVYPEAGIALSTGTTWTTSITNNSSNWNTAYTDRLKWDGNSTGLVASTGRTSLGGTTVGQSMFTLTNPSSVTFPQFNSDNTVTALSANSFRSAIGAGVGSVTSVTAASTSGNPLSINNINTTPSIDILSATSARNGYLTSTDWTTFNNKQNAIGYTPANSSTTISTTAPLSGGGDLSSNKTLSIAQASTNTNGYLTSTDWTTFNGKQTQLNGTGFVKASGTTISYDNSSYLPLTGGTLTGALNGTSINLNAGIDVSGNFSTSYHTNVSGLFRGYQVLIAPNIDYGQTRIHFPNRPVTEGFSDYGSGIRHKWAGSDARNSFLSLYTSNFSNLQIDAISIDASGNVGIRDTTPSYTLDVNGTLNATGAATLSSTLAVTGNITEGGNNVLNNLDTVSLSNRINNKVTLSGDETITGTKTFTTGITTANLRLSNTISGTNYLIGYNNSGGAVGQVTVGSGLNLTSDVLTATNPTEKYYFNLGIVAGAADNSNATYDFTYGSNAFIVPTSLNGYCIDSVYIRAVGCSTCPPGAGEKDYYVGVYKATAGNNVTTSGATLVGSQITMNEYDLNQVNRNDTLTTGDVWWVYLNGNYVSDLAYITAGFLVKKTCN